MSEDPSGGYWDVQGDIWVWPFLLKDGDGVLTHCNAGPLATSRYGTGQGPLFLGKERGMDFHVYADETRPLLQGARLTAYELQRAGSMSR